MLKVRWNEGDAIDTTDLLPDHWFVEDSRHEFRQHPVAGVYRPHGYARCVVDVDGPITDLDYAGEHEAYNLSAGYIPGVMRLIFSDTGRVGIPEVKWKGVGEHEFRACDVTVSREPAPITTVDPFDPEDNCDGRKKIKRLVAIRQGQSMFRDALLVAYRTRCALTGCTVEEVLQAAHIVPYRGRHTNHVSNGVLLRADIHTLFDLGIIKIDREYRVSAPASIIKTFGLPERITNLPVNKAEFPSPDALEAKFHLSSL